MGFIRLQEERLAKRLIRWRYQRMDIKEPPSAELELQASRIVNDAHRIARKRGGNVVSIIKEMIRDMKK